MSTSPRPWSVEPGPTPTTQIQWDDESYTLGVQLAWPLSLAGEAARSRDAAFGIRQQTASLMISDLELELDAHLRPIAVELRSNPAQWGRASILVGAAQRGGLHLEGPFEEGPMFSESVSLTLTYDGAQCLLKVAVKGRSPDGPAVMLGSHVRVGLDCQGYLESLVFFRVDGV